MYWYVSSSKLSALASARPWTKATLKKLKLGPFEVEGTLKDWRSSGERAEEICLQLDETGDTGAPDRIAAGTPFPYLRFSGSTARSMNKEACWFALVDRGVAILLVGSPSHAQGGGTSSSDSPSPSADPVGSAREAFGGSPSLALAGNLSYVWQFVWSQGGGQSGVLPRTEGCAVFGGLFDADRGQLRSCGQGQVEKVLIASPIYIKQY